MSKTAQTDKKHTKPTKPHKTEIRKSTVDEITNRRTFEPFDKPTVGCRFHRFRKRGESLTGILGFPISNFRQCSSYPLELDSGEVVEIVGNRFLHQQIRKGGLCGQRVEIVYQGREFMGGGHYRKIYRVFKIQM
ncbi:MAG: hypothetical protein FVQ80_15210 [Planctomycetes bacterium]|nr:hypothetical protein [Planctomycetota bacterium]